MVEPLTAHPSAATQSAGASAAKPAPDARKFFANLLDIINPLQHIPVVSTIYRSMTGDEISGPAKLVGGALFGGAIGAAAAAISVVVEDATGRDVGEHALALVTGDQPPPQDASQLAAAQPQPADQPADIAWNGPRVLAATDPALASAATALNPQPPAQPTAAPTLADLLANAPIQAPQQPAPSSTTAAATNPPLLAQSTLQRESAADLANRITWSGPRLAATAQPAPADTADDQTTSDAQLAAAEPPANWVGQAIAQAQAITAQPAAGTAPAGAPEPWIAGAMIQALEKYEALAISRTTPGDS